MRAYSKSRKHAIINIFSELKEQNIINFGGIHKQSLIDYPGNVAAVLFTYGCNFSCDYCHNRQLIGLPESDEAVLMNAGVLWDWIYENRNLLDAVVITGGEPTLHRGLPDFIHRIRMAGLKVKLDTNGTNPEMVDYLIKMNMIDYIAMDIKAPLNTGRYKKVAGERFDEVMMEKVVKSVGILNRGNVEYEFRTTCHKSLLVEDYVSIANGITGKYFIQNRIEKSGKVIPRIGDDELDIIKSHISSSLDIEIRN